MTEQRKAVIKNADMSEVMQQEAVDLASQALSKYNIEKVRSTQVIINACNTLPFALIFVRSTSVSHNHVFFPSFSLFLHMNK